MKAFKVINNPEAFQILADETRRRIVYLLRAKERTVSQIAEELDLTPQAIYHHIRKLRDADMVEVAREERVDHFIETYYSATAEVFHLAHGEGQSPAQAGGKIREALEGLGKIGFPMRTDAETVAKMVDMEKRMEAIWAKQGWTDRAADLQDVDFFAKQSILEYAKLLSMTDHECDEYMRLYKGFRKLLKSRLIEPVAVKPRA